MATGVGTGFDFSSLNKSLKEADAKLSKLMQKLQETERVGVKAFQNIANNGVDAVIKKLQEANKSLGGTSKIVDMINRIVTAFGKLKGDTKVGVSTKDGDAAIKKLQKEIAQLQKQQEKTARQVDKWKNKYDKLSQSVKSGGDNAKKFQETQSKMLDTAGQLKRALASAFSVSAIKGYVGQVIRVRGEFELQQRALAAIIQNQEEANILWEKTTALAVKSPFSVQQLTRYTKQLAAFRVETSQLYETNKMLADVSAGLGVEMDRLILAFGQVKAANFLRGTELRQFSEAGVNILEELALHFETVYGRAYSVAEVFEMVSKRMVTFEDVEQVFKNITQEGGVFYQMQEKQAMTLQGQISNLHDAFDLMFNDIGKSKQGVISDFLSSIRSIINNWEYWADVALPFLGALIVRLGVINAMAKGSWLRNLISGFMSFIRFVKLATKSTVGFTGALKTLQASTIIGWLIMLVGAIWSVVEAFSASDDAAAKMAERTAEFQGETDKLTKRFKELNDILKDNAKTTEEQNKAYQEIKRTYRDYLSEQELERENLIALNGSYDEYIEKIEEARKVKERETMINFAKTELAVDSEVLRDVFQVFEKGDKNFNMVNAYAQIEEITNQILGGEITDATDAVNQLWKAIGQKPEDYTGKDDFGMFSSWKALFNQYDLGNISEDLQDYFQNLIDVNDRYKETQDLATKAASEFINTLGGTPTTLEEFEKQNERIEEKIQSIGDASQETSSMVDRLVDTFGRLWNVITNKDYNVDNYQEALEKYQENLTDNMRLVLEAHNQLDESFQQSIGSGIRSWFKADDEEIEAWVNRIYDFKKDAQGVVELAESSGAASKAITEANLETAKANIALANILLGNLGDKTNNGRTRDLTQERIRVIREIYEAYEELNNTLDETTAKTGAIDKFGDAFYSAFGKTVEEMGFDLYSAEGVVDAYQKLVEMLTNQNDITKAQLAKGEFVMEYDVELQKGRDQYVTQEIADMFSGYELSIELDKLNIPRGLAEELFGVDTFDLSQIREQIEKEIEEARNTGGREDFIEERQKELERLEELERKSFEERMKTYSKYLLQAQSERAKIRIEELRQLKEIESLEIDEDTKSTMRSGVQRETQKALDAQEWKDFKNSDMYIRLFEDLDMVSMRTLENMEERLLDMRNSLKELSPSELKEINTQLEKIREIKVEKNPFTGLLDDAKNYYEYLQNRKKWEAKLEQGERQAELTQENIDNQQVVIARLEQELSDAKLAGEEELLTAIEERLTYEKEYLNTLLAELEAQKLINSEDAERIRKGINAGSALKKRISEYENYFNTIASTISDIADKWDSAFGLSESAKASFDTILGVAQGAGNMAIGVGKAIANPADIGAYIQAAQGLMTVFATFGQAYDNKKERQIQREIKLVGRLQKVYEDLEKTIDKAYSINTYEKAFQNTNDNLVQQIQARERMIEAEEDKKDTDHDKIEQWREENEEALEQIKELESQRLQELGGIGGEDYYKDAAQGFVDAWLDAFYETGDGLMALEEEFDEVMKNLVKKQVLQRVAGALLEPLLTSIDTAVGNDGLFDEKEFANVMELAKQIFPDFNEKMKETIEAMGMSDWAGKNAELGSLSAGIQSVSQETADTISAYLNSIRFFVADSNTQLKSLVAAQGIDTDTPNPMLSQLLVIAEQTRAIRDLFDSVVVGGHKMGRSGIKVFID